jgi:diguanylate cyclase
LYKDRLEVVDLKKWNRKILNIHWIAAIIALITELMIYTTMFHPGDRIDINYLKIKVFWPMYVNVVLLCLVEIIYFLIKDKIKEGVKYLLIISSTAMVCNLVYAHYDVAVIFALFAFPIFISVLYASKRLACFASGLNLAAYMIFFYIFLPGKPPQSYGHNMMDFWTIIAMMIAATLLVFAFLGRLKEIMESLISLYENEQQLTIKNFIMEFNSKIEPATGLYNHKTFYEYLGALIEQSENFRFPLSLAVLDIDNFKKINDKYGHSLGDEVIKALAELIKSSIMADEFAARYGGEEFAIIFTDKNKNQAFEICEKIRSRFNGTVINDMPGETFSISIGLSEHKKGMPKEVFFTYADKALYKAKHNGKNQTVVSDDEKNFNI